MDSISIPRGIPSEFKARDQIAAGFESVVCIWCTMNKNVDWINYLYYNQQRFLNYSIDAFDGIVAQLEPNSAMTMQNRAAIDLVWAELHGATVCSLFDSMCCTFIPDSTSKDGSVTRALNQMKSLSQELARNSGFDDNRWSWLTGAFENWQSMLITVLTSVGVILLILVLFACCVLPCIRSVLTRFISSSVSLRMIHHPVIVGATLGQIVHQPRTPEAPPLAQAVTSSRPPRSNPRRSSSCRAPRRPRTPSTSGRERSHTYGNLSLEPMPTYGNVRFTRSGPSTPPTPDYTDHPDLSSHESIVMASGDGEGPSGYVRSPSGYVPPFSEYEFMSSSP